MLKRLRIGHFKSIEEADIDLQDFTIFVGLNGSGKSNLIDSLRFLRDCAATGLDHAINLRGGPALVRQYSPTRPYIVSLSITTSDTINDQRFDSSYSLRISGGRDEVIIEDESVSWMQDSLIVNNQGEFAEKFERITLNRDRNGKLSWTDTDSLIPDIGFPPNRLILGSFIPLQKRPRSYVVGKPIVDKLRNIRFTSVYPNILREPARIDIDRRLKEDCSNWASVIRAMRERRETDQQLRRVISMMREITPTLENVIVKNVGGYLVPQFLFKGPTEKTGNLFDPVQLSDGTLRLFCILLSLYQRPAPSFLAIEEPEQTIHPGLLPVISEAFTEASKEMQLAITTHSPHLLDYCPSEKIRVVYLDDGMTKVASIRDSQKKVIKEGLMKISEIMALDGLKPGSDK